MNISTANIDPAEQSRFDELAASWWDPEGESRPLHELNPARLRYIAERVSMRDCKVVDVGCGGGILTEAMAARGALATGIDVAERTLQVARLHLQESGLEVEYENVTAEDYADSHPGQFDAVTCMELLEHVPDPVSVIKACAALLRPGGQCFLSTLNRTPAAFAVGIVGAEHIARLIPRGTHRYDRFIRPSEMCEWLRGCGMEIRDITGLHYNPFARTARLGGHTRVNYLVHALKPEQLA